MEQVLSNEGCLQGIMHECQQDLTSKATPLKHSNEASSYIEVLALLKFALISDFEVLERGKMLYGCLSSFQLVFFFFF